jgi:hypothetical protein
MSCVSDADTIIIRFLRLFLVMNMVCICSLPDAYECIPCDLAVVRDRNGKHSVGTLIELTTAESLKPVLVSKLAGPLIRIVGDRFPAPVKTAILHTLGLLIAKAGQHLKQFLPPLQTAFVKTLYDSAAVVRVAGARALAQLMTLTPKLEPLLNEVLQSIKTKPDSDLRFTSLCHLFFFGFFFFPPHFSKPYNW